MNFLILILIISANCVKTNCDEEGSTTEVGNAVTEKTEPLSTDTETLENKTEDKENQNDTSKISETSAEIRVSRSSSDSSTEKETQSENSSKLLITESSLANKSASDEVSETQDKQSDSIEDSQQASNSEDATEAEKKSSKKAEKQLEKSTKTSASETEDRNPQDFSEASAESKLSDNKKASFRLDDSDRNSETEEVKDISDELLNEIRATRRMLSAPDNVIVDSKMRADTISTTVKPELRTAPNQNLNLYNNYKEFGTNNNAKLSDSSRAQPMNTKKHMPVVTKLAPEEISNQRYFTKLNPRPELGMIFPNVNSDFHGPLDLPIYLEVKQSEDQTRNQNQHRFIEPHMSQLKSNKETYFPPNIQQHFEQPQRTLFPEQFENIQMRTQNKEPRLYHNPVPIQSRNNMDNIQLANKNQPPRNQIQRLYENPEKLNDNHKNFNRDLNIETRNAEIEENVKMPSNYNNFVNKYPKFHQHNEMIDTKANFENKQLRADHMANTYPYMQYPIPQRMNVEFLPPNIRLLFQKLASASMYPTDLRGHIHTNNNIQNRPHFAFPDYAAGFSLNFG